MNHAQTNSADLAAMPSWAILKKTFQEAGLDIACLSAVLRKNGAGRIPGDTLDAWTREADEFANINPLEKLIRLLRFLHEHRHPLSLHPLHWLAGRLGYSVVYPKSVIPKKGADLFKTWHQVAQTLDELRIEVCTAIDCEMHQSRPARAITTHEWPRLECCWAEACAWIDGFLGTSSALGRPLDNLPSPGMPVFHHSSSGAVFTQLFYPARKSVVERLRRVDFAGRETPIQSGKALLQPASQTVARPFADAAAAEGRYSYESTLTKWAEGQRNPLDHCLPITQLSKSLLPLRWLAHYCGVHLISTAKPIRWPPERLIETWLSLRTEIGELEAAIGRAIERDGVIDPAERTRVSKEWNDVKCCVAGFICQATSAD